MGNKKCQWKELLENFSRYCPNLCYNQGNEDRPSSVPRGYQQPLCPRAGTLHGSEDQLGLYISSNFEGVEVVSGGYGFEHNDFEPSSKGEGQCTVAREHSYWK